MKSISIIFTSPSDYLLDRVLVLVAKGTYCNYLVKNNRLAYNSGFVQGGGALFRDVTVCGRCSLKVANQW